MASIFRVRQRLSRIPIAVWVGVPLAFLLIIGLLETFSAASIQYVLNGISPFAFIRNQALFVVVGVVGCVLLAHFNITTSRIRWSVASVILFIVSLLAQLATVTPLGVEVGGNRNWLRFGSIQVQPSEFLKLTLIVLLAMVISHRTFRLRLGKLYLILGVGLTCLAVYILSHDLGTCVVIMLIVLLVLIFIGTKLKQLVWIIGSLGLVSIILVALGSHTRARILATYGGMCHYEPNDPEVCYQSIHGMFALSNGGLFGTGIGDGLQKWGYLPEAQNDFIFAIIGEEMGLVGVTALLLAFGFLIFGLVKLLKKQDLLFGRIIIFAVISWICSQALINIASVVWIFPIVGVPLPFVSAGGSSMIASLLAVGLALGTNYKKREKIRLVK